MARKLLDIGYDLGGTLCPSSAADTTSLGNMITGYRTLEGTQQQLAVNDAIETCAPKVERLMNKGSGVSHHAGLIVLSLDESAQLEQQLTILFLLVHDGSIKTVVLDAANVKPDACHDAKQTRKQQCVVCGKNAKADGNKRQRT
jgi:hypothetical protein